MVKESKSAATIRRKRLHVAGPGDVRGYVSHHKSGTGDDDLNEEDPEFHQWVTRGGPRLLRLMLSSDKILFLTLVAFRVVNSLLIQTAYVPDEYWQSLEVAHKMQFGYGYQTWEWKHGLRGFTYPFLFFILYKVLALFHLDNRILLIKLPRLLQGIFAATGDLFLYKFSRKMAGTGAAQWALLCQLTSWFTFYCAPRTLSNSMETTLTSVALYYFPWPDKPRKAQWKYLTLVGLAVVIRPTAAIVWLPLCVWHLWMYRHSPCSVIKLFAERGFVILSLSSILDRIFYGKWVNVHYNFLQFNFLSDMGTFYGSHPWHWYLTQGLPVILGTHVFPFIMAIRKFKLKAEIGVMAWTTFVYSLLGHKEFRFLFPILPLAMHICGVHLHSICDQEEDDSLSQDNDLYPQGQRSQKQERKQPIYARAKVVIVFLIVTNLPLAMYMSVIHQRGTVDVMRHLHEDSSDSEKRILFLMPCHSTPYYSYLHQNISMRFLTCEPNLEKQVNYIDEADVFYQMPSQWLHEEYGSKVKDMPTHIVLFNQLVPQVEDFLEAHGYRECVRLFHTHVPEGRVGSHVLVYCSGKNFKTPMHTKVPLPRHHG